MIRLWPWKRSPEPEAAPTPPCPACHGLGFVSHDEKHLNEAFNIWGLTRHAHADGRVTWEGDCRICAIPRGGRVYVPFGWVGRGWA